MELLLLVIIETYRIKMFHESSHNGVVHDWRFGKL